MTVSGCCCRASEFAYVAGLSQNSETTHCLFSGPFGAAQIGVTLAPSVLVAVCIGRRLLRRGSLRLARMSARYRCELSAARGMPLVYPWAWVAMRLVGHDLQVAVGRCVGLSAAEWRAMLGKPWGLLSDRAWSFPPRSRLPGRRPSVARSAIPGPRAGRLRQRASFALHCVLGGMRQARRWRRRTSRFF